MVSSRRSASNSNSSFAVNNGEDKKTYEEIIGEGGGHSALSQRLVSFRKWVQDAGCTVHPAVCIVNGEATDGTRNAPVLILQPPTSATPSKPVSTAEGRCGLIDTDEDRVLYDRTIGCQIRTAREMKEGQIMMKVPRTVMIHPDLIAASDVGRATLACCEPLESGANFWDAFGNTAAKEQSYADKIQSSGGTQLLVKILQERKKVENILSKAVKAMENGETPECKLAPKGTISTRAALLLFLIQQRFSDCGEPKVCSDEYSEENAIECGASCVQRIDLPEETPETFAPYARTLPPSVPLPICWKRNELALLAGCIPGTSVLQEVAGQILTLTSDLISLIEAGILHRFPTIFSAKTLTWDRWLWAASVHMSRILPVSCFLNKNEQSGRDHVPEKGESFYSPPDVWDELGVMIPLIDMLNHEVEETQIKWESPVQRIIDSDDDDMQNGLGDMDDNIAKVIITKRVKKGSQIYTSYGCDSSKYLMLKYGFAQMVNIADTVTIGFAISDCVGNLPTPSDYTSLEKLNEEEKVDQNVKCHVYESFDPEAIKNWWTDDRWSVMESEIKGSPIDPNFWNSMKKGKKLTATANNDGTYDPILLTLMAVATMSPWAIKTHIDNQGESEGEKPGIRMTKRHQEILRQFMLFFYTRKLERLLENLGNGLKAHFNNVNLWTKSSEGFLDHNNSEEMDTSEDSSKATGWNSFFDNYAYAAAMEVENRYYSLAPDSCVLTLYDGNLRALQTSLNGALSVATFKESVGKQLSDLGFILSDEDFDEDLVEEVIVVDPTKSAEAVQDDDRKRQSEEKKENGKELSKKQVNGEKTSSGEKKERKKNRQRNRKHGGPPAIKLHIGNLSYQTLPSRLFDYFAMRYGRESVIECHIPTERESGKSRGFGFVTLSEGVALRILAENAPHEIDGRVVKLAESNTSVQARAGQKCPTPNMPGFQHGGFPGGPPMSMMPPPPGHMHPDDIYGPGPGSGPFHGNLDPYDQGFGRGMNLEFDSRGGRRRSRSWNRMRSRSPSPRYRRREDSRDRYHDRSYRERRGRSYSRSRSRSRSRSYSRRDRDRRDRDRDWDRDSRRSSRRSRGSSRRSSRYSRSRSRSLSRSRSPSYPKDTSSSSRRDRDRDRKSSGSSNIDPPNNQPRSGRSRSRSKSVPNQGRDSDLDHSKREGGKSSRRGRSKSRERNQRSRKRSKGSRRSKESSKRSRSF